MAITEYVVVCNQQATSQQSFAQTATAVGFKTPTPSGENEIIGFINTADVVVVNAESTTAAINGVKALFPGRITGKVFVGKKSTGEEK